MSFSFRRLLLLIGIVFSAASAPAMSVLPPTFEQLVSVSELVLRGQVTDVHSAASDTPSGRKVSTYVTFRVEHMLKGAAPETGTVTLRFLGGKVGKDAMEVPGMPSFQVGDREIVFVWGNGHTVCPLTAAGHGRYRLLHDAASNREYIARDNRTPLESTDDVSLPLDSPAAAALLKSPARALSTSDFETQITATLNRLNSPAASTQN